MIAQNVANFNQKRNYFTLLDAWYSHPIRHTLTAGEREVMNAILHVANVYRFAPVLEIPKAALCRIACVCKDTLRHALETFQNLCDQASGESSGTSTAAGVSCIPQ